MPDGDGGERLACLARSSGQPELVRLNVAPLDGGHRCAGGISLCDLAGEMAQALLIGADGGRTGGNAELFQVGGHGGHH